MINETHRSQLDRWIQAEGPHSKLGKFYRRELNQLESEPSPSMDFFWSEPGKKHPKRNLGLVRMVLEDNHFQVKENDLGGITAEKRYGEISRSEFYFDNQGRVVSQYYDGKFSSYEYPHFERNYTYDDAGRLIGQEEAFYSTEGEKIPSNVEKYLYQAGKPDKQYTLEHTKFYEIADPLGVTTTLTYEERMSQKKESFT